jgi:hypothetical protein
MVREEVIDTNIFRQAKTEKFEVWHTYAKHYECMKCKKAFIAEAHRIDEIRNTPREEK